MKKLFVMAAVLLAVNASALTPKQVGQLRIPGQRVKNACVQYAFSLNYELFKRGIESRLIAYDWSARWGHAVVLFRIDQQWYLIENEHDTAFPVTGNTDWERVRSYDKTALRLAPSNFYAIEKVPGYLQQLEKHSTYNSNVR